MKTIEATCQLCKRTDVVTVNAHDYRMFIGGVLVQKAFPKLSAAERETLIGSRSGFYMCDACWGDDPDE